MLLLLLALVLPPQVPPLNVPAAVPPVRAIHPDCACGDLCECEPCRGKCFQTTLAKAHATGKPVIIWIGMEPEKERFPANAIHLKVKEYRKVSTPGWFTSKGDVDYFHDKAIFGKEVSQSASPFPEESLSSSDRLLDRLEVADDDSKPASWPKSVPFLKGLRPFARARYTQSIFKLNDAPTIDSVPRSLVPPNKEDPRITWQVSGGMDGIDKSLWHSEVYKLVPGSQFVYYNLTPVKNSFGFYQHEYGYQHNYPDGTVFMDVLSNAKSGKVFEHRVAEKDAGKWRRYVAFKDVQERPEGYKGLQGMTCATCHNTSANGPGSGGYGVGLVPGGDTVVSDPFPRLER